MKRIYDEKVLEKLISQKILIVKGPKYSEKAKYIQSLIESFSTVAIFDCEDKKIKQKLASIEKEELSLLFDAPYILLKEAQNLQSIQSLVETILFSGSFNCNLVLTSSFDPLLMEDLITALKMEEAIIDIYPMLFQEIANHVGLVQLDQNLQDRLIYGNFSAVLKSEKPEEMLREIIEQMIFTHLNPNERINKKEKLMKVLQYLSFKLGEPLSYHEIGEYATLDNETVERYIHLLTKCYVLIKLPSYYHGNRYEMKKTHLFYFIDNGIRNALTNNFNPIELRIDQAALWKNWLISERIKWNQFLGKKMNYYIWRTNTKQTVDFIEEDETQTMAYQFLWDKRKKAKFPNSFQEHYPNLVRHNINKSTYWTFLTKKK